MKDFVSRLGPAIIVASIVLGPGSLFSSAKVGAQFGYSMLWVLALATLLMVAATTLSAANGIFSSDTPCQQIANRLGKPAALVVGMTLFIIIICFQASNNIAILSAIEGVISTGDPDPDARPLKSPQLSGLILFGINLFIVVSLYGVRSIYQLIEKLMMTIVLAMLAGFTINLLFAQPALTQILTGLVPTGEFFTVFSESPAVNDDGVTDPFRPLQALIATTLSIAGAFYQSYLVREKGWQADSFRDGITDAIIGILLLGLISGMVICTAASVLHGEVAAENLRSTIDIARLLRPSFGSFAASLFAGGVFAAAFSSFLGNALIGGTILSDAMGHGSKLSEPGPRNWTVVALLLGMSIAIYTAASSSSLVGVVLVAQSLTVVGVPLLMIVMLYNAIVINRDRPASIPRPLIFAGLVSLSVVSILAVRTGWRIYLQL